MKRTYLIVCPSCRGNGYIDNPSGIAASTHIRCPACNGSKVVTVVEESEE